MTSAYFTLASTSSTQANLGGDPTAASTHLQAEQSEVGGVRVDLPKHFPLVETCSLLVFCARWRLLTTELKMNYWLVKSQMSVTQCDLLWANRIKSKLLTCKPGVLKGPVFKAFQLWAKSAVRETQTEEVEELGNLIFLLVLKYHNWERRLVWREYKADKKLNVCM